MNENVIRWINIAIGLEDKGLKFYTKCLSVAEKSEVKDLFDFLVKAETTHKEALQKTLDAYKKEDPVLVKKVVETFLKEKIKVPVFKEEEIPHIMKKGSLMAKFNKAMDFEREGMAFYIGVMLKEKDPELKKLLQKLASDELVHKQEIEKLGFGMFAVASFDIA